MARTEGAVLGSIGGCWPWPEWVSVWTWCSCSFQGPALAASAERGISILKVLHPTLSPPEPRPLCSLWPRSPCLSLSLREVWPYPLLLPLSPSLRIGLSSGALLGRGCRHPALPVRFSGSHTPSEPWGDWRAPSSSLSHCLGSFPGLVPIAFPPEPLEKGLD